jgi:hypothetical protein
MSFKFDYQNGKLSINGEDVISTGGNVLSSKVAVTPYNTITATDLQDALEQLADQSFRGSETPTGNNVEEGDLWYNTTNENFYIYRETSSNVFQWVPVALGTGNSDTLDGGAF